MCAIVKGPLHSDMASGNIGALCFSRWRGRAIARDVWTGTDPATSDQLTRRARLTAVSQRWGGTLTATQRASWEALAKTKRFPDQFGEMKGISGYSLFLKRNMNASPWISGYIDTPIEGGEKMYIGLFELTFQISYPRVWVRPRYGLSGNNQDYYDYWRAGPYESPARNPIAGEWRRKHQELASWYDTTIITGKYYWYRMRGGWASGVFGDWYTETVAT